MKKTFLAICCSLLWLLVACNDGEYTVERISFEGTELYSCTGDTTTNFVYKTQGKQALILQFRNGLLSNRVDTLTGDIGNGYTLLYRTFDNAPNNAYFCTSPPAVTPRVTSEIQAQGGRVSIITREVVDTVAGTVKYKHLISISDLLLTNENGERLVERNFNFGSYNTSR